MVTLSRPFERSLSEFLQKAFTSSIDSLEDIDEFVAQHSINLCKDAQQQKIGTLVVMDHSRSKIIKHLVYLGLPDYDEVVSQLGYNLDEVHYMVHCGPDIDLEWASTD